MRTLCLLVLNCYHPGIHLFYLQLGLEVHDNPNLYPLGWVNKDVKLKVTKQCKNKIAISANYIDEVEIDVQNYREVRPPT